MADTSYLYSPDVVFPPGETLRELMEARGIEQAELAASLGVSEEALAQLIDGCSILTDEMASKLERVLGVRASFWRNLRDAGGEGDGW